MTYFGGKAQEGVYQTIINHIPPHAVYIEPFLGGGAIMRYKRPAARNIGIDLDAGALARYQRQNCLESTQLIQADALEFLTAVTGKPAYDRGSTFIYCDPPYPHSTRSCDRCRYAYEMTDADHVKLLTILRDMMASIAITTYPNDLYARILWDWNRTEFTSVAWSGEPRTEYLYMNYTKPAILHDDRYLGTGANNRQDINRRIGRTVGRITRWPKPERLKMLKDLLGKLPEDELDYLRCSIGGNTLPGS